MPHLHNHWCCYNGAKGGHGPLTFVQILLVYVLDHINFAIANLAYHAVAPLLVYS